MSKLLIFFVVIGPIFCPGVVATCDLHNVFECSLSMGVEYLSDLYKGTAGFNQIGFNDAASPTMIGIVDLHHTIFFYMIVISVLVLWLLFAIIWRFSVSWTFPHGVFFLKLEKPKHVLAKLKGYVCMSKYDRNVYFDELKITPEHLRFQAHNTLKSEGFILPVSPFKYFASYKYFRKLTHGLFLEIIWTLFPCIILSLIALPSFALLYSMDEIVNPSVTLKVEGHQWYWSYEYGDYVDVPGIGEIKFDSRMLLEDELENPLDLRLLSVSNAIVLPIETHIRFLVTSADVLHSFTITSLGFKIDAVPGRLNQVFTYILDTGIYYGQCSELCGSYHGFMPISLKAVTLAQYEQFLNWAGTPQPLPMEPLNPLSGAEIQKATSPLEVPPVVDAHNIPNKPAHSSDEFTEEDWRRLRNSLWWAAGLDPERPLKDQ